MGLTDFGSIFFRYRLLRHSGYYLASKVTVLLPQQADQSYISLLVTQKAALSEKGGGEGHISLQVSTENKASGMGEAHSHSDGEVKMRCRTKSGSLGSGDLFLSIASNFCIWPKFWFAFSNYQGNSVKVLLPFYKILQNSICERSKRRAREELLRGQLRWLN